MIENLRKNDLIFKNENILKENIVETDKLIKYIFNITILLGGLSFLIVGLSSYIGYNIIMFFNASEIIFFPQGLTMCFYGVAGIIVGLNQLKILILEAGEGYNEFNKEKKVMTIFRKGIQGKNSDINISYPLTDIEAIKIEINTDLFNSKQKIFVCLKGKNDLPIIQLEKPLKINELEEKAIEIASFLKVPVKGI
uniref:Photosystem I assembly protein Ycf4 n=1 Tax=Euglena viridis TaxID=3040 RepID=M1ETS1_EUGVI|nr:photosystem I assembly protein ycf4 [Euglena viridis]AEY70792.2 photosystem I assembly protein ycf4 [Euglena viridis]